MSGPTWFDENEAMGPPYVGWLTPESELEEIELGDRVCDFLVNWMLVAAYSTEESRLRSAATQLVGTVAYGTSHIGLPFPPRWWPPSAGAMPEGMRAV